MATPRRLVRALALSALPVITVIGCADPWSNGPATVSPIATSPGRQVIPTVGQLNDALHQWLDPAVPATEVSRYIQHGDLDPTVAERIRARLATVPAGLVFTDPITGHRDGTFSAASVVFRNSQVTTHDVTFVSEGGQWQLSATDLCDFLTALAVTSPICAR